jgi:hypothetical protein
MHDDDDGTGAEFVQGLIDHARVKFRRGIRLAFSNAPAVAGAVDQDHAMMLGQHFAERLSHRLEIAARAMHQQDRRAGGVGRPQFDHIQRRAGDIHNFPLERIMALDHKNADLRDQRQHHQRSHDNNWNHCDFPGHDHQLRGGRARGFALKLWNIPVLSWIPVIRASSAIL